MKIHHVQISNTQEYSIPKRIGAYIITHTVDNVHAEKYIGSTKNLYNRICSGHCNKNILSIDLFITDDINLSISLERILMELLKPATNILIPSLSDSDKEIMNELIEDKKIKELISNSTVRLGCRHLKYIKKYDIQQKHQIRTGFRTGMGSAAIILTGLIEPGTEYICWKESNGDIILRKR